MTKFCHCLGHGDVGCFESLAIGLDAGCLDTAKGVHRWWSIGGTHKAAVGHWTRIVAPSPYHHRTCWVGHTAFFFPFHNQIFETIMKLKKYPTGFPPSSGLFVYHRSFLSPPLFIFKCKKFLKCLIVQYYLPDHSLHTLSSKLVEYVV